MTCLGFFRLLVISQAAAVVAAGGLMSASAQGVDETAALVRKLQCQSGQDCAAESVFGTKRGSSSGVAKKRSFEFLKEEELEAIEVRAEEGNLPSVDVEIYFDYDSSEILPPARQKLTQIGQALLHPKLMQSKFVFIGHTDSRGSESYNQALSERRAAAVRQYLLQAFPIEPIRLSSYGRGESRLKSRSDPTAAVNRRVQIINVETVAQSGQ